MGRFAPAHLHWTEINSAACSIEIKFLSGFFVSVVSSVVIIIPSFFSSQMMHTIKPNRAAQASLIAAFHKIHTFFSPSSLTSLEMFGSLSRSIFYFMNAFMFSFILQFLKSPSLFILIPFFFVRACAFRWNTCFKMQQNFRDSMWISLRNGRLFILHPFQIQFCVSLHVRFHCICGSNSNCFARSPFGFMIFLKENFHHWEIIIRNFCVFIFPERLFYPSQSQTNPVGHESWYFYVRNSPPKVN